MCFLKGTINSVLCRFLHCYLFKKTQKNSKNHGIFSHSFHIFVHYVCFTTRRKKNKKREGKMKEYKNLVCIREKFDKAQKTEVKRIDFLEIIMMC